MRRRLQPKLAKRKLPRGATGERAEIVGENFLTLTIIYTYAGKVSVPPSPSLSLPLPLPLSLRSVNATIKNTLKNVPIVVGQETFNKKQHRVVPAWEGKKGRMGKQEGEGAASVLGHKVKVPETWAWKLQFLQRWLLLLLREAKGRGALRHK